jgi:hypothetical protein
LASDLSSVMGSVGILTIATRGPKGPGELLLSMHSGSESFLAWSDEPLARGTTVIVVETRGARTVQVVPWAQPTVTSSTPLD